MPPPDAASTDYAPGIRFLANLPELCAACADADRCGRLRDVRVRAPQRVGTEPGGTDERVRLGAAPEQLNMSV